MSRRLLTCLGVLLAGHLATLWLGLSTPLATDFTKFYASARQVRQGGSIYAPLDPGRYAAPGESELIEVGIHPNLNPPLLTLFLLPLSRLPWSLAYVLWTLASLASGMLAIGWFCRALVPAPSTNATLGWLSVLLIFYPTWATLRFGQVSLFLLLLVVLFWKSWRGGREAWAATALGILMGLKLFFGLFLLYLLVRKRFSLLAKSLLVLAGCWGLSAVVLGPGVVSGYREALSGITWTGARWNASLQGFFTRLFGGSEGTPLWNAPWAGRILAALLAVAGALLVLWSSRRASEGWEWSFFLVLPLMLLLSPLGWLYYFPLLLLPVILLWWTGRKPAALGFLLLSSLPFPFQEAPLVRGYLDCFIYSGVYFYALIWLAGWLTREVVRGETRLNGAPSAPE